MDKPNGQMIQPGGANTQEANDIHDPLLDPSTHHHTSFSEAATLPLTAASPFAGSEPCPASEAARRSTDSKQHKTKHDCQVYEIVDAGSLPDKINQRDEKSITADRMSANSKRSKKSVQIQKVESSTEGAAAEAKPDLLSIPQTNFAIGLLVMCCFNPPFGLLALYCSLRAAAAYRDGDKTRGARFARTSIVVSLLGIMLTMVIITSVVLYIAVNKNNARKANKAMSSNSLGF